MYYKIIDNTPDNWQIIKVELKDSETFNTLEEAKKELIDICNSIIEDELEMIKQVKKLKRTIKSYT